MKYWPMWQTYHIFVIIAGWLSPKLCRDVINILHTMFRAIAMKSLSWILIAWFFNMIISLLYKIILVFQKLLRKKLCSILYLFTLLEIGAWLAITECMESAWINILFCLLNLFWRISCRTLMQYVSLKLITNCMRKPLPHGCWIAVHEITEIVYPHKE